MKRVLKIIGVACLFGVLLCSVGCTPTVKVETSDKPIVINLNVKIEHEIRVKVDQELESIFSENSGLF